MGLLHNLNSEYTMPGKLVFPIIKTIIINKICSYISFYRTNKHLIELLIKNKNIYSKSSEIELIENYQSYINTLFDILNADESFLLSVLLKHLQNEINTSISAKKIDKIVNKETTCKRNITLNNCSIKKKIVQEAFINKTIIYDEKNKNTNLNYNNALKSEYHRECFIDLLDILKLIFVKTWAKPSIGIIWDFSFDDFKKFIPGQQRKRLFDVKTFFNKMMLAKSIKIKKFYF